MTVERQGVSGAWGDSAGGGTLVRRAFGRMEVVADNLIQASVRAA